MKAPHHLHMTSLIITLLIALALFAEMAYFAPHRLRLDAHILTSTDIPASFDDFTVVFFTDLHMENETDARILTQLRDKINQLSPDVILFGGDLIDKQETDLSVTQQQRLTDILADLEAPYGKFWVSGNHDLVSESTLARADVIMNQAGFTRIDNQSIELHRGDRDYIRLSGIANMVNGTPDIEGAFSQVSGDVYTIVLDHTPDAITQMSDQRVDVMLSGHSHGGQIRLPLIGSLIRNDGAKTYEHGTTQVNQTTLIVSNGIGTSGFRVRLLADPQIQLLTLKYQ